MKQRVAVLLMLGMMPWTGLHAEQSASASFRVTVRVEATCDVTANNPIQGTTLLRATCTPDSSYTIGTTTDTHTVIGVGTGTSQDHRVFGAVLAAQVIPAGGHADTITVRIYY